MPPFIGGEKMNSIRHNNDLKLDANYYSEKTFDKDIQIDMSLDVKDENEKDILLQKIDNIKKVINFLPDNIKDTILSPIIGLEDEIKKSDDNSLGNKKEEVEIKIEKPDTDYDDIFGDDDEIIKVHISDDEDLIDKKYIKDISDITNEYIIRLQNIVADFISQLNELILSSNNLTTVLSINKVNSKDIKNKNLLHLNDYNTKTSILLDRKTRLYKKLFNIDNTVNHLRLCRTSFQLKKRYLNIEKEKSSDFNSIESNKLLKASINEYEDKYNNSFLNLYKYLMSSADFTEDCLKDILGTLHAKNYLIDKGGIIS